MKRIGLCIAIIAAIIMIAVGSYFYIVGTADSLIGQVQLVKTYSESDDYAAALIAAEEAERIWNDFFDSQIFISDKEHIMEITGSVSRIKSLAQTESDDLPVECDSAITLIKLYRGKQGIGLNNIL